MTVEQRAAEIHRIVKRLDALLNAPEWGCTTWVVAVGKALDEIAEYAPHEVNDHAPSASRDAALAKLDWWAQCG